MIENVAFIWPASGDFPEIVGKERAVLYCGCAAYVGRRADNEEAAVQVVPCAPEHQPLMEQFNQSLLDSLDNPTTRPLIEVCDEYLEALGGS